MLVDYLRILKAIMVAILIALATIAVFILSGGLQTFMYLPIG